MKYSVVIAEREEPDLKNTVANIKENSGAHVIVMSDTKGIGPQAMRDRGIGLASGSDVVIIMDGHMRVKPGALDAMAEWCKSNPSSVAVAECFHSYEQNWEGQPYSGAKFSWKDYGDEEKKHPTVMVGKWRSKHTVGQIPCVMGACYAFTRDWYMDGLRKPWQWGTGWGCDEEILSAATWLRGGTVDILPVQVWHQARKAGKVPYKISDGQWDGITANKVKLVNMMPMTKEESIDLLEHLLPQKNSTNAKNLDNMARIIYKTKDNINEYREFLSNGPLSWQEFKQNYIGVETIKPMKMKELRKLAKTAGIKVPFGCNKDKLTNMIQAASGFDIGSNLVEIAEIIKEKAPKPIANWGANETNTAGKRECTHCKHGATVVSRTKEPKPPSRLKVRYRKCKRCDKNFTTVEIITTP